MNPRPRETARGQRRREAVLAAAQAVFLERGFEATTLDDVIRRAGGSRATVYAQFGNKEALFAAIIEQLCTKLRALLQTAALSAGDPATVLHRFATAYMAVLMAPEGLALYRVVIGEAARFPELGRQVFRAGPQSAANALSEYLRSEHAAGRLSVPDAELAARLFLEMVKGDLHTRALFGVEPPSSPSEIRRCVRESTRMFVQALQPAGPRVAARKGSAASTKARRR